MEERGHSPPSFEKLVYDFAEFLVERGHKVSVAAPFTSVFPKGVVGIETVQLPIQRDRDDLAYFNYATRIEAVDVIHDFSHGHVYARRHQNAATLNLIWDNLITRYSKAPRNIVALSKWQEIGFTNLYGQKARFVPTVCANENRYLPSGESTNRFLIVGKMSRDKGILEALRLCKIAGAEADVVGGGLATDDPTYKYEVMRMCDGSRFVYWGEVNDEVKIHLLQGAKAVLNGRIVPEAFWHVGIEAMLCGTPAIAFRHSSYPEIIQDGLSGFLCEDETTFLNAMKNVEELDSQRIREYAMRFSRSKVVSDYVRAYEGVANGEWWQ